MRGSGAGLMPTFGNPAGFLALLAIPAIVGHQTNAGLVRSGNVTQVEAMQKANEPIWVPLTFPVLGAIGVLIGGKLKRR